VTHAWTIDEKVLPVEKVPASGRFDLRDRAVCGQDLDNGFAGWEGAALMHTRGDPFRIEMRSADVSFFQLYSPASGGLYVAEPVSHANAALNEPEERWAELGLRVLDPGGEISLTTRWSVIAA
jgi:aldose 1-epimerase